MILITGANGFLGQHLLDELKNDSLPTRIIVRKADSVFWTSNRNFETRINDLSDITILDTAFQGVNVVIHLAAERTDEKYFFSGNILATENLIEMAIKHKIKKIIFLSSISVFGLKNIGKKLNVKENHHCSPQSEYGRTKFQAEQILIKACEKNNIELIILRAASMFGECQPSKYLFPLFEAVKANKFIVRHADAVFNFVYVRDVANAIRFFLFRETGFMIITIGQSISFEEFLKLLPKNFPAKCKIIRIPGFFILTIRSLKYFGFRELERKLTSVSNCTVYDDTFVKAVIGYKYGLSYGFKKTLNHYEI